MDEININDSEFAKTLVLKTAQIFANHLRLYSNPESKPNVEFENYGDDAREKQLKQIFMKFTLISDYLDKQQLCRKMIYSELVGEYCSQNGISEKDYYQYHYENFLVTTTSLLDLLAGLGNVLYKLGLKRNKCNLVNYRKVNKREKLESSLVLNEFEKYLKKVKSSRNIIVHAGGFQSQEIESIESKIFNSELIQIDSLLQEWFEGQKREEVEKLITNIEDIIEGSLQYILRFLEIIEQKLNEI